MNLEIIQTIITASIPLLIFYFGKRWEQKQNEIQAELKERDAYFNSNFDYKRKSLEELIAPIIIQTTRSEKTLYNYKGNDAYKEEIFKKCNETVRDLLLEKSFLIPSDLVSAAGDFLSHYDVWLQQYHQIRIVEQDMGKKFVFTYNFPGEALEKFRAKYCEFRSDLKIDTDKAKCLHNFDYSNHPQREKEK